MQDLCKLFLYNSKNPILVFFLILSLISPIILAETLVEPYNDPITYSAGDLRWCRRYGVCTLSTLTLDTLTVYNLSVIGDVFNVTMNLVTWNITESFNVGGNLIAKNGTFDYLTANYFFGNNSQAATFIVAASDSLHRDTADYVCTGTNDDVCIENALGDLPAGGGKVFLLEGEYKLGGTISFPSGNIILEGSGKPTHLNCTCGIINIAAKDDITIKNIRITARTVDAGIQITGNSQRIIITNNYFENLAYGIANVFAEQATSFIASNNYFENIKTDGILLGYLTSSQINNNIFLSGNGNFIEIVEGGGHNVISNNVIKNANRGVYLQNSDGNSFIGNTFDNIKTDCFYIRSNENTVASNVLDSCGNQTTDTNNGIYIYGDKNIINSNRIKDSGKYGIYIRSNEEYNIIANNNIHGAHNLTIKDDGINTTIIGNYPGGSSMEIQTVEGQDIIMKPYGTKTGNWTPKLFQVYGNASFDNNTLFVDSSINRVGIGQTSGFDPRMGLSITGDMDVTHIATEADDHAVEIDVDAVGFGDVKGIDMVYVTGAISTGKDEAIILINIDESLATGGEIDGLEVLATEGSADIHGLRVGALVGPIHQDSGTFTDMDSANNSGVDNLSNFISSSDDHPIFVNDNDYVTIGDVDKFEEIEFLLNTTSSNPGIKPTFEFSTGVGTWSTFFPIDGTNGMRNTGIIAWLDKDIPTWATGAGTEYLIRITRTQNILQTSPIEDKVQIAAVVIYKWDKNGDLIINEINGSILRSDSWANVSITESQISDLVDKNCSVSGSCASTGVAYMNYPNSGNFNLSDGNITIQEGFYSCLNADCTKFICANATAVVINSNVTNNGIRC